MGFGVVADGAWVTGATGADEVCCAQPATARRRRAGREVVRGLIKKFRGRI